VRATPSQCSSSGRGSESRRSRAPARRKACRTR
jgi:hypothetical protein